ncbi:MAG: hypothetical protein AAF485_11110, partial [Chloroflexota bacterium]
MLKQNQLLMIIFSVALATILLGGGLALAAQISQIRATTSSDGANRDSRDASISDDGTKVVFESDSDFFSQGIVTGQQEIWLYDTTTMTLTRITTSTDGANRDSRDPSISGDGTRIAFKSDSDFLGQGLGQGQDEIWIYDMTTMTYTRITSSTDGGNRNSNDPSLNEDGTRVAFESEADFLKQGIANIQFEIWIYDTTTMTFTRVTSSSNGPTRRSRDPSLNADGTRVAFQSDSNLLGQEVVEGQREIWIYDTTTMTYTRVTTSSDGSNRSSSKASLSADGTKVAFQSSSDLLGQGSSQTEIWLYDTTMMTYTRITSITGGGNRGSELASISADGKKVAFESDIDFFGQGLPVFQDEIWIYDTETMTVTRITTAPTDATDGEEPSLNGDGTIVAFESDSDFLGQGVVAAGTFDQI